MTSHHVIVGDGLTAAEFATSKQYRSGDKLTIIGANVHNLGRGVAYAIAPHDAPWRYAYLLNSPARSVDPDFARWMPDNWEAIVEKMSGRSPDWLSAAKPYADIGDIASLNAPREIYGDFFHAAICKKLDKLEAAGVRIERLPTRVVSIEPTEVGLVLTTSDGQQVKADSIDVATGGPLNQRFAGDDSDCFFPELFGFEQRIAEKLLPGGTIICIGAAAAMLDCLRFCQSIQRESTVQFTALSPSGTMLEALRPSAPFKPTHFELTGTFDKADHFLSAIKTLQRAALASGDSLYETRVGMRELFMKKGLNQFVPDITEARKVSRPLFNHFQGGTRDSIDDFNRLLVAGNTRILAGRVDHINHHNGKASVVFSDQAGKQQTLNASVVVNCAGPGNDHRFDILTSAMLRKNWISICAQSGGIIVGKDGRTSVDGVRYLGPAVTSIGDVVEPVPLYDASRLRRAVQRLNDTD